MHVVVKNMYYESTCSTYLNNNPEEFSYDNNLQSFCIDKPLLDYHISKVSGDRPHYFRTTFQLDPTTKTVKMEIGNNIECDNFFRGKVKWLL